MKTFQKWVLLCAVMGLAVGTFVTLSHSYMAPAWSIILPIGVIATGYFLITLVLQNEAVKFDEDERLKREPTRCHRLPTPDIGEKRAEGLASAPSALKVLDQNRGGHHHVTAKEAKDVGVTKGIPTSLVSHFCL